MADNAIRYGFRWATSNGVACPKPIPMIVASGQAFAADSATAANLQPGDPVSITAAGTINLTAEGAPNFGIMVALGHDGKVFNSTFSVNGVLHPSSFIPSNVVYGTSLENQTIALVVPSSTGLWEIDSDQTLADQAAWQALVGQNADHSFTAPLAASKDVRPRLDAPDPAPGSAGWRIERISPTALNQDFSGANVKLIVRVNETQEAPYVTAGV